MNKGIMHILQGTIRNVQRKNHLISWFVLILYSSNFGMCHRYIRFCFIGQFSSVMSNSLQPHGLQHARLPCPSPTPRAYSNLCPSSWWCHPSHPLPSHSPPTFNLSQHQHTKSQFFVSGSQSIGVSAKASALPMNIQDWFPLGWTGWISLQSNGLSSLLQHHSSKASILYNSVIKA